MPNWCMNNVEITGEIEKLEMLVEGIKKDEFLNTLEPIGEWEYGKAIDAWGTKWDVSNVDWELDYDTNTLTLNFDTAWGPPISAYERGEENHNIEINASYYEPGMMFVGHYEESMDSSYNIDFDDENWSEQIPQDLIDHWGLDYEYESWQEWQDEEE